MIFVGTYFNGNLGSPFSVEKKEAFSLQCKSNFLNSLQKIVFACYYGQKLVTNTLFEVTRTAGLPGVLINYYNGFKGIITVCFKQLINLKSVLGRNNYTVSH